MMNILVQGADRIARDFATASTTLDPAVYRLTRMYTQLGVTAVKQKASGRPGPRVITGDYRRSIRGTTQREMDTAVGTIWTDRPQGPRLERGFSGADALGRYCVDMQTEAMTRSGWATADMLKVGQEILTLDPATWTSR